MLDLIFEFTDTISGWIDFYFSYGPIRISYSFSNVCTKPEELIKWIEDVYNNQFTEFDCDMEDVHWYLDYDGKFLTISDTRNFEGTNEHNEKRPRLKIQIEKDKLCTLLYSSFRRFATSNLYSRIHWDGETLEEFLVEKFGTLDTALEEASKGTLNDFYLKCLQFMPSSKHLLFFEIFEEFESEKARKLSEQFDNYSIEEKKNFIKKYLDDWESPMVAEVNLMTLKSEPLEKLIKA